jgi:hypothetical protein
LRFLLFLLAARGRRSRVVVELLLHVVDPACECTAVLYLSEQHRCTDVAGAGASRECVIRRTEQRRRGREKRRRHGCGAKTRCTTPTSTAAASSAHRG